MRVIIENNGETVWMRDTESNGGISCLSYEEDGMKEKVISALEDALKQVKSQSLSGND
ncbi:hypothetical protein [Vibrio sp. E150_018]